MINTIGVYTSGGDAPGMNACIRAVVRACSYYQLACVGIQQGYEGMIDGNFVALGARSVANIMHRGGTVLKTARSERFRTPEGRKQAFEQLTDKGIDALVVIGGDGSFTGAHHLAQEYGIPIIGVPATIDNDLYGTDYSIGFDTATNTVMEAIDKIRDTASSHDRLFFVEVMGRQSGQIALQSGISAGAIGMLVPEDPNSIDQLVQKLDLYLKIYKKTFCLVLVAEGYAEGGAFQVAEKVAEKFKGFESKVTVLGHLQRGGNPSCFDRLLASRLGVSAVEMLLEGRRGVMAGLVNNQVVEVPLADAIKGRKEVDSSLLRLSTILSV